MKFKPAILEELNNGHPGGYVPQTFVETGSWKGLTTALAAAHFAEVHTVERSPVYFLRVADKFKMHPDVHCHFGDSAQLLGALCELLPEAPVMFYLDAHWFNVDHAVGRGEFPLWGELEAIAKRGQPDIVVVDDVHSFGTCNPETAWKDVDLASICRALTSLGRSIVPWERPGIDQVAVYLAP